MAENDRLRRAVERLQEDETLRGDLEDKAASALIAWATERVQQAASDATRSDADVEAESQIVRQVAQRIARSGETDPQRLTTQAENTFRTLVQQPPAPLMRAAGEPVVTPVPSAPATNLAASRHRNKYKRLRTYLKRRREAR